ncbi:B2 bradykinin receptor-like [Girardinichthys multiradiatus]|uniref:B2 bradykinin receptor-like n=1 Tax=Girardinichthys multiradiatus TaxID=208333 RepID=UPI001FADF073|nr:B2 bradykinin receptor-like [Girardinichthys multiradiatus]
MALFTTSIPTNLTSLTEDGDKTNIHNCSYESVNWTYTLVPVYVMSISVLGIALNIFVLMVFILHKKPCTVAEIYLTNLAAADLVLVSFLPFWAVSAWNKHKWIFGRALCKMVNVGILMNVYCSIYFLVLVSIDRYLALVHPLSHETMRRPKFAKIGCVLVWILGFLLSIPKLINRELAPDGNVTKCIENDTNMYLVNELMISVFAFFIPILIITFSTLKILKTLTSRFWIDGNLKQTDHKATILVLAVLLAFLICWVPFHLLKIPALLSHVGILTGCSSKTILYICGQIFTYLGFFNSVLNPILYVIVGKNFQKKFKEVFGQWDQKRTSTISFNSASTKLSRSIKSQIPLT